MRKDGTDPSIGVASAGSAEFELYDVPATVVDPHAGRRAAAAIAGRGFGHNEVPTRENKDMVSRLAAHERAMARQRGGEEPDPANLRPTPRVFDPRLDALEEIEGPRHIHFAPIETAPGPSHAGGPDRFDISLTSAGVPLAPRRSRGMFWVLGAVVLAAGLAGVGLHLRQSGLQAKVVTAAPGASLAGR
jgi:hypothetical protein